jgi:hypothetical protein
VGVGRGGGGRKRRRRKRVCKENLTSPFKTIKVRLFFRVLFFFPLPSHKCTFTLTRTCIYTHTHTHTGR